MVSNIVEELYNNYYVNDKTPQQYVSSYWKFWHKKSSVQIESGEIKKFQGVGFGDMQAKSLANHVLSWLTIQLHLLRLGNRQELKGLIKSGKLLSKRMGLRFTMDSFRQVCSFALIRSKVGKKDPRVVVIGDGYGFLSAFIKEMLPRAKVVLIDLGKTLFFQASTCSKGHANSSHFLANKERITPQIYETAEFIYCPAECLSLLEGMPIDWAINLVSMQEMNEFTVKNYFSFLRRNLKPDNVFYCCNRLEKKMDGGEIFRFYSCPWKDGDTHLLEEPCPWNEFYLAVHPAQRGYKLFNRIRIPFINYYDGPIYHRLTKMAV